MPPHMSCPITHEIMVDPVVTADGQSYERTAIEQWLQHSKTSPLTGEPLANLSLTPNMALRRLIQEWIATRPSVHSTEARHTHRSRGRRGGSGGSRGGAAHPNPHPGSRGAPSAASRMVRVAGRSRQ